MEAAALADYFGTYRLQHQPTPQQRRALRWLTALPLILVAVWLVVQFLRGGIDAALGVLIYAVLAIAAGAVNALIGRRLQPLTHLGPEGVSVSSGLTGGRRCLGWQQISSIDVPQRFETYHVAVLMNGDRIELPGLPAPAVKRLKAELGTTPPPKAAPPPSPSATCSDDRDWDGPFHRG